MRFKIIPFWFYLHFIQRPNAFWNWVFFFKILSFLEQNSKNERAIAFLKISQFLSLLFTGKLNI